MGRWHSKRNKEGLTKISERTQGWLHCAEYVPLGDAEILEQLGRIRDGAMQWIVETLEARESKGLGCAWMCFTNACREAERVRGEQPDRPVQIMVNGFDISKIQLGSNAKLIAAGEDQKADKAN